MSTFTFSESTPRILLSSDNHHLVSPLRNSLLRAGFNVDLASDYSHLEMLWQQLRHDVVLFEVSYPSSVESATESALRIKRQDAQQFIAYLADANLQAGGLIGDAIFSRDAHKLPQALRAVLAEQR
jgi:PleD family two-component response regulator